MAGKVSCSSISPVPLLSPSAGAETSKDKCGVNSIARPKNAICNPGSPQATRQGFVSGLMQDARSRKAPGPPTSTPAPAK
ncbi:hypothetical protein F1880_001599 [Penicillium rolfsii]|nr:hypothetical protein F1880_001599 [Penicillium rolfsii]